MIRFNQLSLRRGGKLLFRHADLIIHHGHRVGVTGPNGCGKSSLFRLISGDLQPDSGTLELPSTIAIGQVAQETPATGRAAIEYVIDGDAELRRIEASLALAESEDDGERQATLHARLESIEGYSAPSRAGRLMHGLGFTVNQEQQPVSTFSGGWRMRLNLAQALMCRSNLLLLDEPTNHLDLDAVIWLEDWLKGYRGTLLLVSHDRDFLDAVTTHTLHFSANQIRLYTGNYSAFEEQRAQQLASQQAMLQKQQREVREIQQFVDRFRAKATKARQVQSRLKALQRMQHIAAAHVESPFHFAFAHPDRNPCPLLALQDVVAGYPNTTVLREINLSLSPGDRIGLLGKNGAGKSTLVKVIAGKLPPLSGHRNATEELRLGYFAQHQMEQLSPDLSPLEHLLRLDPRATEQALRDFLGGFGFRDEAALQPTAPFSGGEKARLALALLVYQRPNLLLLDEPTNHLDLEMRHALTRALQDFSGAVVLVSHDRNLLRSTADDLWLVAGARMEPFSGDLEDYRKWLTTPPSQAAADVNHLGSEKEGTGSRRQRRQQEAAERLRLQPLRKALKRLEERLDKLARERAELEHRLADPAAYLDENKAGLRELLEARGKLDRELRETEEDWLTAGEQLEAAELESHP
jgi:ATP-binding cassette subfamily F protein 3